MSEQIQIGEWVVNAGAARLVREGQSQHLEFKDLQVLLHLVEAAPDYVASKDLLATHWQGTVVSDNALHQVIGRLRKHLGDSAREPQYIETLPKLGYRLVAPIKVLKTTGAADTIDTIDTSLANRLGNRAKSVLLICALTAALALIISQAKSAPHREQVLDRWGISMSELRAQPERWQTTLGHTPILAVLPFVAVGHDSKLEPLTSALPAEIRYALRESSRFEVLPGVAVRERSIKDLGQQADLCLDGSLRLDNNQLEATIELIVLPNKRRIWTKQFVGELGDPLTLQTRIAQQVADTLQK